MAGDFQRLPTAWERLSGQDTVSDARRANNMQDSHVARILFGGLIPNAAKVTQLRMATALKILKVVDLFGHGKKLILALYDYVAGLPGLLTRFS